MWRCVLSEVKGVRGRIHVREGLGEFVFQGFYGESWEFYGGDIEMVLTHFLRGQHRTVHVPVIINLWDAIG